MILKTRGHWNLSRPELEFEGCSRETSGPSSVLKHYVRHQDWTLKLLQGALTWEWDRWRRDRLVWRLDPLSCVGFILF